MTCTNSLPPPVEFHALAAAMGVIDEGQGRKFQTNDAWLEDYIHRAERSSRQYAWTVMRRQVVGAGRSNTADCKVSAARVCHNDAPGRTLISNLCALERKRFCTEGDFRRL